MEGQRFVLMEIDIYSGYRFVFPPLNASASTTIHGLTRMPYPPPYILNRIVSYIYIYIFIYLAVLVLTCSTWDLHCRVRDL